MKNNIKYIAGILLGGLIGFSACTDSFESFNTNEAGFDNDSKKQDFNYYGIPLGIIQQGIYFNYDWKRQELAFSDHAKPGGRSILGICA